MSKGYKLYNLKSKKVIVSRDVVFDENAVWNWKNENVEGKTVPAVILEKNPTSSEGEENS